MRILIQECLKASVSIDGEIYSEIGPGEVLFVGFTQGDTKSTVEHMIDKLLHLRIFDDASGKTNLSLEQKGGEIVAVSQFTLYADIRKGNRPSFEQALPRQESLPLYDYFKEVLSEKMPTTKYGVFGADMKVNLINDGPFTIMMDSKELGL